MSRKAVLILNVAYLLKRPLRSSVGLLLLFLWRTLYVCFAGVRMINLSYSRISLADIAQKLLLDSPEDAEYIVAKVGFPIWSLKQKHIFLISAFEDNVSRFPHRDSLTLIFRGIPTTPYISIPPAYGGEDGKRGLLSPNFFFFVSRIERLSGPLDEIVLFSVHKFSVIMSCHKTLSWHHLIRETYGRNVGCFIIFFNFWRT